jgi:hypothetical protein
MMMRIFDKHKAYLDSTKSDHKSFDTTLQQEEYVKLFKIMNPQLADPDCVLKFSTEEFQNHFYNTQALIDEANMTCGKPYNLSTIYHTAMVGILDQAEFESEEILEKRRKAREDFEKRQAQMALHGIMTPEKFFDPTDPARSLPFPPTMDRLYKLTSTDL